MSREERTEENRQKIISAAETLIIKHGDISFTMADVAKISGVSQATPYNLFGTKSSILYRILNKIIDKIENTYCFTKSCEDNLFSPINFAKHMANHLIENERIIKPLHRFQMSELDNINRNTYMKRIFFLWRESVIPLSEDNVLDDNLRTQNYSVDDIAYALMTQFIGITDIWSQDEISKIDFLNQINYDLSLIIYSCSNEKNRNIIHNFIRNQVK